MRREAGIQRLRSTPLLKRQTTLVVGYSRPTTPLPNPPDWWWEGLLSTAIRAGAERGQFFVTLSRASGRSRRMQFYKTQSGSGIEAKNSSTVFTG